MKHNLILAVAVLCFSSIGLAQNPATDDLAAKKQKYLEQTMAVLEEDSARITTSMARAEFKGTEDIVIDITLKNVGTKDFGASEGFDHADFFFDIEVTNQTGRKIPFLPSRGRRHEAWQAPAWGVTPAKSMIGSVWLNKAFDLDMVGTYKVVASKKFRRDGAVVTVSSEPLTFRISSVSPVADWKRA